MNTSCNFVASQLVTAMTHGPNVVGRYLGVFYRACVASFSCYKLLMLYAVSVKEIANMYMYLCVMTTDQMRKKNGK